MSDTEQKRCAEMVTDAGGWHRHPCGNRARYGNFCGVHAPEKRAQRAAKRGPTQWEREMRAREWQREEHELLLRVAAAAEDADKRGGLTQELEDALDALRRARERTR